MQQTHNHLCTDVFVRVCEADLFKLRVACSAIYLLVACLISKCDLTGALNTKGKSVVSLGGAVMLGRYWFSFLPIPRVKSW